MNMPKAIDLTGQRFGRLIALKIANEKTSKNRSAYWMCKCDCGKTATVRSDALTTGRTKSCGCIKKYADEQKLNIKKNIHEKDLFDGTSLQGILLSKPLQKNNTSGIRGVSFNSKKGKWQADIKFKKIKIYLGCFIDINDAIAARKAAEEKYFKPVLEEYENQNEGVENE